MQSTGSCCYREEAQGEDTRLGTGDAAVARHSLAIRGGRAQEGRSSVEELQRNKGENYGSGRQQRSSGTAEKLQRMAATIEGTCRETTQGLRQRIIEAAASKAQQCGRDSTVADWLKQGGKDVHRLASCRHSSQHPVRSWRGPTPHFWKAHMKNIVAELAKLNPE